jgi:hypothetical protein
MGNMISNTSQGSPVTENRRMEAKQVYEHITGPNGRSIVELAGAPIDGEWIKGAIESRGTLFLQGELKSLGQGDTASNFRFKTDKDKNNVVVSNLTELFKLYHEQQKNKETPEPVVVTSVPRKMRTQVYHMGKCEVDSGVTATGEIWVSSSTAEDPTTQRLTTETETIQKFIEKMGIEVEFAQMANSTEGAGYRTYMADLISFVLMIDYHFHKEMFERKKFEAVRVKADDKDESGEPLLKEFDQGGGRMWKPREGHDYLYFKEVAASYDSDHTNTFCYPKEGSLDKVYSQIHQLLSLEESGFKEMVRKFFSEVKSYGRISDHWLNDIDDPFTFYMFYNCYLYSCTEEENKVKDQIEKIIQSFS